MPQPASEVNITGDGAPSCPTKGKKCHRDSVWSAVTVSALLRGHGGMRSSTVKGRFLCGTHGSTLSFAITHHVGKEQGNTELHRGAGDLEAGEGLGLCSRQNLKESSGPRHRSLYSAYKHPGLPRAINRASEPLSSPGGGGFWD